MGIAERKEREKLQRRKDIIDAAEKVFFYRGFESATMDEIAEKVELSKGTLYLYFKSKEEACKFAQENEKRLLGIEIRKKAQRERDKAQRERDRPFEVKC